MRVKFCGDCIEAIDPCACNPCGYEIINTQCLRLHPIPCGLPMDSLEVTVSVMPDYDLCTVPQELAKQQDLIQKIASSVLLSMPKKVWTDTRSASGLAASARAELVQLRREVHGSFAPAQDYDYRSQAL